MKGPLVNTMQSLPQWIQIILNAGALVLGGSVWKIYIQNLKAAAASKEAETSVVREEVNFWRDKASELEKRTPEAVERILSDRITIREAEIVRLKEDKENSSQELEKAEKDVAVLQRAMRQSAGFREMLALEATLPGSDNPGAESDFVAELEGIVGVEVELIGYVGVDSGQLLITDPCYIDHEWLDEPFEDNRVYRDTQTGEILRWGQHFKRFDEPLQSYGATPNDLIASSRLVQLPKPSKPEKFNYSYNGACQATLSDGGFGELVYPATGDEGAGVVFRTGWGDGLYPIYGEKQDGRIIRVYVNTA